MPPPREQWDERVCECAAAEEEYQSAAAWCGGKGVCVGAHISARSSFFCPRTAYDSLILIRVRDLSL